VLPSIATVAVGLGACQSTVNEATAPATTFQASAASTLGETGPSATPSTKPATATKAPAGASRACLPTDQDRYVYHPARLAVKAACLRVSGVIDAIRSEADGDLHILLRLDGPYRQLLRPANAGEELGDLVIEPICVHAVSQPDAVSPCAADPDPLQNLPHTGMQVWMEGRYVLDLDHGGWAELHPLYGWGPLGGSTGGGTTTVSPTPRPTAATSGGYYRPPGWDGVSDVDCSDFSTHAQAQSFFLGTGGSRSNDRYGLDRDHDGLACESLP
jgi:Excalibur calcium-binding domain.